MTRCHVSARSVWKRWSLAPGSISGLFLLLALAGCGGEGPSESATSGSGADESLASIDRGDLSSASRLELAEPVHHLGALTREPMVVEHPDGTLFVAGYGSQIRGVDPRAMPLLWRSRDRGRSFQIMQVGDPEDGAIGNSDVDLAMTPTGVLYFASMGFDRSQGVGTHIALGRSADGGESFDWTLLSEDRYDDRPWVAVAPDGVVHVLWNDDRGVSYAVSEDGGDSYQERPRIHPAGGSSHLAIGPAGEIAVRITPLAASGNTFTEGLELIATSRDGGLSWTKHPAPGERVWDPTFRNRSLVPRWVEPLAFSSSGVLHHLWSEGTTMVLASSSDLGESWQRHAIAEEEEPAYFPFLAAGPDDLLAATWFTGFGERLVAHLALIVTGDPPRVLRSEPFQPDAWVVTDDSGGRERSPAGEYLPVLFLSTGELVVASPIQDEAAGRDGFTWWSATPVG